PVGAARLARDLPGTEADLVPAAHDRARLRREAARQREARVRCVALARLLGAAGFGDRVQARRLPAGADRTAPVPVDGPALSPAPRRGPPALGRGLART